MSIFGIKKHNTELDNTMDRVLDMGGNGIINLGNPDKPNDAVSRIYVYRKIQNLIRDHKLHDIKTIKDLLKTESKNIAELTNDLKQNEKIIVDLQSKIEKEMTTLTKAMEDLADGSDKTFDQIKEVLKANIVLINKQIKDLAENMIKHEELKTKLAEVREKLQNMYKLEINAEIKKLNDDTEKRNLDLLNSFLSKHSELKDDLERQFSKAKAEIEKSASDRGDDHEAELKKAMTDFDNKLKVLQELFKNQILTHTENYNTLLNLSDVLQEHIGKIYKKIKDIENSLDFATDKLVEQGDSIDIIKDQLDAFDKQDTIFERRIENAYHKIETNHEETTKRADDLGKVMLDLIKKINRHEKDIHEIPLFELTFHRKSSFKVLGASRGIPLLYEINEFNNELKVKTEDIFSAFDFKSSSIVDYEGFIEKNHKFNIKTIGDVHGFKIKKSGWYIIEVNIDVSNISPLISVDNFYFHADEIKAFLIVNKVNFTLRIKKEFTKNTPFVIYPIINSSDRSGSDPEFTINPGSYFKLTYYWENDPLFS